MKQESVDSLDAYMASLALPSSDQSMSMAQARAEYNTNRSAVCNGVFVVVKNRRYRHLQQLLEEDISEDHFFSDAMMQQRSPALFHFYLGQYLGLDRRAKSSSLDETKQTLSSFLMDTCQRSEMEARRMAEQKTWGHFIAADEKREEIRLQHLYEDDNIEKEKEEEEEEEEEGAAVFTTDERRKQLIQIMSTRFLDGEDGEYVNYAEIDADETLDDLVEMQRDAEDRYFADGRDTVY
ncbi:hypothetical protein KXD40_005649 [Peronospora effusa]|uniref:CCD97-like C-terminal domain-containing protein n=1 Tax=Peronospora effusa TaxID=542832 RepID=A0A3M6VJU9_9STRA|nr:hypothetical protein DD238_006112 [Peronospora effusa]RQM14714.1 hypothetical protein DD237_006493 [Peronospora effusa]UIZ27280.1 hypothetical protein KXD40_005649 [Peronospora effusa]CAI5727638.1 unnamed protein product [Peronospora effusa]